MPLRLNIIWLTEHCTIFQGVKIAACMSSFVANFPRLRGNSNDIGIISSHSIKHTHAAVIKFVLM